MFGRFTSKQSNYGGDPLPHTTRNDPIVGYRTWRVLQTLEGPYALHSLHIEYWWNVENTAACHANAMAMFPRPELHDGGSPDLTCNCGLYSQTADQPLTEWNHMVSGRVRASGTIALSGTIIKCERGYKGQYATIQSPVVLEVDCCRYHGFCGNPVTQIALPDSRIRDAYGHCDDHLEPRNEDAVMVPAEMFMRNVQEQLTTRYTPVEFLTWYDI